MNKKLCIAALLALLIAFTGCQFAMEEGKKAGNDRFVGISLRVDDPGQPDGIDEDGSPYWNMPEEELHSLDEAQIHLRGDELVIKYPEDYRQKPISPYAYYVYKTENEYGISNNIEGNWPGSLHSNIIINDDGEAIELDGVVYICGTRFTEDSYIVLHLDSVYQREDGSLYALDEHGGFCGMLSGVSQRMETRETIRMPDGTEQSWGFTYDVRFEAIPELTEARILAFDADHTLLSSTEISPEKQEPYGNYESRYAIPKNASYLLLEETGTDAYGKAVITRTVTEAVAKSDTALFTYYFPAGDGFALQCDVFTA